MTRCKWKRGKQLRRRGNADLDPSVSNEIPVWPEFHANCDEEREKKRKKNK